MADRAVERLDHLAAALHRIGPLLLVLPGVERLDFFRVHLPERLAAERGDVVGQVPHLGVGGRVCERRHRRARHAGAQAEVDVARRLSPVKGPGLGQVGGAKRLIPVVLERVLHRSGAAAVGSVAGRALQRLVDLPAARHAVRRVRDRGAERHDLDRLAPETRREGLHVADDVGNVPVRQQALQAGMAEPGSPSRTLRTMSSSVGRLPVSVVRSL